MFAVWLAATPEPPFKRPGEDEGASEGTGHQVCSKSKTDCQQCQPGIRALQDDTHDARHASRWDAERRQQPDSVYIANARAYSRSRLSPPRFVSK